MTQQLSSHEAWLINRTRLLKERGELIRRVWYWRGVSAFCAVVSGFAIYIAVDAANVARDTWRTLHTVENQRDDALRLAEKGAQLVERCIGIDTPKKQQAVPVPPATTTAKGFWQR